MKQPTLKRPVFVYGTLRTRQVYHGLVAKYVHTAKKATILGKLYHLSEGYPAVVFGGGIVRGEVFHFTDHESAYAAMDDLEDYHGPGEPNLYERVLTTATLEDGTSIECFVYVFPEDRVPWLEQNAIPIDGDDWIQYMGLTDTSP